MPWVNPVEQSDKPDWGYIAIKIVLGILLTSMFFVGLYLAVACGSSGYP